VASAFAAYGRKEFQAALKQNIRGGTFDVIPPRLVRSRMKKSDARILARVKRFIDDPRFPVSLFFLAPRRLTFNLLLLVYRRTAAFSAHSRAKFARPPVSGSLALVVVRPSAVCAALWRRHTSNASPLPPT
jgi:hypothetical protein